MIKKLLSSILITLLFVTNVFASDTTLSIDINNNISTIKLTGINKNIHALQLDIIDESGNTNIGFNTSKKFNYSIVKENTENGKTTISIVLDNSSSLTENGTLDVGTLTFKNKPNLSKNATLELVNLDEGLKGQSENIIANINIKNDTDNQTESTTSSNSSSSGGGANVGNSSDNKTESATQDTNKKEDNNNKNYSNKIDINSMYPVIKQSNFKDTANHWANESIKYLADRGIINGMNDNQFAPNNNITRAEFITLLAKMDNIDINKYKAEIFTDVPANAWFNPYIDWAAKNGITSGTTANTFAPNNNITREQMAVMIERFCNYKNFSLNNNKPQINFTDTNNISSYASSSVAKVQQAGIINGRPDGSFAPKANATRGESAQMIYTMLTIQ